jgi:hypothetical protein
VKTTRKTLAILLVFALLATLLSGLSMLAEDAYPDGTTPGEWRWDGELQEWVFEEYPPPIINLPQTGDTVILPYIFLLLGICLVGIGMAIKISSARNGRHTRR